MTSSRKFGGKTKQVINDIKQKTVTFQDGTKDNKESVRTCQNTGRRLLFQVVRKMHLFVVVGVFLGVKPAKDERLV